MGAVGNVAKQAASVATLGVSDGLFDGNQTGNGEEGWVAQQDLDAIKNETSQEQGEAQKYQTALPFEQQKQGEEAGDIGRKNLAATNAQIDKNTNGRGLLYSGVNQGAKNQAAGQYASGLMNSQAQINQQTNATSQALNNRAIQAGLQSQQAQAGQAAADYNVNEQTNKNNQALIGGAIGSVGKLAGAGLAK